MTERNSLKDVQTLNPMSGLVENCLFRKLTTLFPHSPEQVNHLLESDAELVRLGNGQILAITVDHIVEEIAAGLYTDAYLIGWMTVIVNMSDLAAVGARPIGILLAQQFSDEMPENELLEMQRGIADACRACGTFVLGGDTNFSEDLQSGGTAIGLIKGDAIISRKGCKNGDILFASGKMGQGSAFAFEKTFPKKHNTSVAFQPQAKLDEGEIIRAFGSSCIDTSDGFIAALSNLMEVNQLGYQVDHPVKNFVHQDALDISLAYDIPSWVFLAGPHGEFELLFTIPKRNLNGFLTKAASVNWYPIRLGEVIPEYKLFFHSVEKLLEVNPFRIVNLYGESGGHPELFLKELLKLHNIWQLE